MGAGGDDRSRCIPRVRDVVASSIPGWFGTRPLDRDGSPLTPKRSRQRLDPVALATGDDVKVRRSDGDCGRSDERARTRQWRAGDPAQGGRRPGRPPGRARRGARGQEWCAGWPGRRPRPPMKFGPRGRCPQRPVETVEPAAILTPRAHDTRLRGPTAAWRRGRWPERMEVRVLAEI